MLITLERSLVPAISATGPFTPIQPPMIFQSTTAARLTQVRAIKVLVSQRN